MNQVKKMEADFNQICSLGPRYREPFLEHQLLIWKLYIAWNTICVVVGGMFTVSPIFMLLYQSLIVTQDEHMTRPLVFPLWLPADDPYRSPNYELLFVLESMYGFVFVITYGGYVYVLFHFLLHFYIMMDMIILDFEVMFDGLDVSVANLPRSNASRVAVEKVLSRRLQRIVTWHVSVQRSIKLITTVFRSPMVYAMSMSSIVICLLAYLEAEKLDNGEIDILLILLGVASVIQLWIPCYLGTILRNKGFEMGDACWNCGWHETSLGGMIRPDIIIFIQQAQVPIILKYTGLTVVQLETFSAIISSAYSYFNMLRQSGAAAR